LATRCRGLVISLRPFPPPSLYTHTPSTGLYPLSLHDALPISQGAFPHLEELAWAKLLAGEVVDVGIREKLYAISTTGDLFAPTKDRKSTRLNSSHVKISYAVFCLKKKKKIGIQRQLAPHTGGV